MSLDPLTIAGIALGVGSSVVGTVGAVNAADYRSQVALRNAQLAEDNAARSEQRAQVEGQDQDAVTLAALGEQVAQQSASGLSLNSKSFGAARKNTRTLGRLDTLRIRQGGDLEAYNYKTDAANFRAEAEQERRGKGQAILSGILSAGTSVVGGLGSKGSLMTRANKVRDPSNIYSARLPRPRPRSLLR